MVRFEEVLMMMTIIVMTIVQDESGGLLMSQGGHVVPTGRYADFALQNDVGPLPRSSL